MMRILLPFLIMTFFSWSTNASQRTVLIEGLSFDLGIVARNIATYKSCIDALDDKGEEDMAIYYSEAFIIRMHLFKKLEPEDRDFATQTARFYAMELDKVPFQKMKLMCQHTYKMLIDLE